MHKPKKMSKWTERGKSKWDIRQPNQKNTNKGDGKNITQQEKSWYKKDIA